MWRVLTGGDQSMHFPYGWTTKSLSFISRVKSATRGNTLLTGEIVVMDSVFTDVKISLYRNSSKQRRFCHQGTSENYSSSGDNPSVSTTLRLRTIMRQIHVRGNRLTFHSSSRT
ncbi:CFF_HP2_G0027960.mRNA.1.CDS.1 [Saccharomyces cerevisiae]|nr:CFF_HP2_G0027960.mRNA.1.CDS.1 [Saccharomyces cerevisiae]CAI6660326.1 CFF_HP2_G0027960.mRNA.1.CDS.1 [Saccharomyces cerevisiae]